MSTQIQKKTSTTGAWFFAVLAVLYIISPIDIIPDFPVIGWVDDFFVATTASLNLIQKNLVDTNNILSKMVGLIKWIIIILGIISILIMVLLIFVIFKIFK